MMFNRITEQGFTLIELLVKVVVIGIFISFLGVFTINKDKMREEETKANLHIIQVAIERYEVDHNKYPPFLLGGDQIGWYKWHLKNDEIEPENEYEKAKPSNNLVIDPLIAYGYLDSYPSNPFVDDGLSVIKSTSGKGSEYESDYRPGDGDPRFGFAGDKMGNGLDDPAFYKHRTSGIPPVETSLVETSRTLSHGAVFKNGFLEPPYGLHYMMGGRKAFDENGNVITAATWWPGNFLYRGLFTWRSG